MRQLSRPYDVVARYGGEEFGLILNQTDLIEARNIGQRLLEAIRQISISPEDQQLRITASAGLVSTLNCRTKVSVKHILKQADAALYEAKGRGRDRMVEAADF